jgi:phosphate transport system protein
MQTDEELAAGSSQPAGTLDIRAGMVAPTDDPLEGHTSRTVDQTLLGLRMHAVEMGGLVIDQIGNGVQALLDRDARLAELVLSREPTVNDYDDRLDRDSIQFIALQQPVANDLRAARSIARIGIELERVGDESKKIARFALQLGSVAAHDPVIAVARYLRHMADLSMSMLRSAVRALDESSAGLAREVLSRDKELDREYATAIRQMMSFVLQDHQFLKASIDTMFALKGLERVGDHAKNIAEQVLYMVEGEGWRKDVSRPPAAAR